MYKGTLAHALLAALPNDVGGNLSYEEAEYAAEAVVRKGILSLEGMGILMTSGEVAADVATNIGLSTTDPTK